MSATTTRVTRPVPAAAHIVFARLCDLDAHRDLAAPHIEILDLEGPAGARTGGVVQLNGPLGINVRARTAVCAASYPHELAGTARTEAGTVGTITWRLEPGEDATTVTAELDAQPRTACDRLLLAAGGRAWLRRRLATAIDRLGAMAAADGGSPVQGAPHKRRSTRNALPEQRASLTSWP